MTSSWSTQSAGVAVTAILSRYLGQANAACSRLQTKEDSEALHDFRVALRRMHSIWRAYGLRLKDPLREKSARRIKRLLASTGAARDAQVHLHWLTTEVATLDTGAQPAFARLSEILAATLTVELTRLGERVPRKFARLAQYLEHELDKHRDSDARPFAKLARTELSRTANAYLRQLTQIQAATATPLTDIHKARIIGKRLRYLLEPLADELPDGKLLCHKLAQWQDLIGGLHDLQVFGEWLAEIAAETAREGMREALQAVPSSDHNALQNSLPGLATVIAERDQSLARQLQQRLAGDEIEQIAALATQVVTALQKDQGSSEHVRPSS